MKIFSIIAIPAFIGFYYNKRQISKHCIDKFKKYLMTIEFEESGYNIYRAPLDDKCTDFVNFYLDKSGLDRYLNCKYEDELNIPKSVLRNESFIVAIREGICQISILKVKYGEIYLRIEN